MGYAGIVAGGLNTNVQNNSDPYFHTVNIDQIQNNLTYSRVSVVRDISNNPPVVTPMTAIAYTIPKSTAFVLTANATDPDGDALTYTWEQVDNSSVSDRYSTRTTIGTVNNNGASFRSLIPTSDPTRYFPKLATVLSGAVRNNAQWEATYSVPRTTNFRVTVRDNKGAESQTAYTTQRIVVGSAEPFAVNTASGSPEEGVNKVTLGELAVNDITKPKVQVYPNPASDILNVTNVSAKTSYKIFNVAGQLVSTGNINNGEVKVSQLAKGVYIISFEDNANVSNIKFEKK